MLMEGRGSRGERPMCSLHVRCTQGPVWGGVRMCPALWGEKMGSGVRVRSAGLLGRFTAWFSSFSQR